MRPNKQINPGAHKSGTASGGKNRYFASPPPEDQEEVEAEPPRLVLPDSVRLEAAQPVATKYDGRGTVGPGLVEEPAVTEDLEHAEWVDPLDTEEHRDLTSVSIDLRENLREDAPESYYQRYSSRVPGHRPQ